MLGAIIGDIIGSVYEQSPVKTLDFPLLSSHSTFTDDSVLSVAVADVLLTGIDYTTAFRTYHRNYPDRGYGYGFTRWVGSDNTEPYNSYGNGSAMRVNPVGWAFPTLTETLREAERSAAVTHNHAEGIKGAQAVAATIYLARTGESKIVIRNYLQDTFHYNLERTLDQIRPHYSFDVSCQGSVPEAIIAFLESTDYESAVRNAVSLGGDSDTMACIAGAVAEACYRSINRELVAEVRQRLPAQLLEIVDRFTGKYGC